MMGNLKEREIDKYISERDFLATVIEFAEWHHWRVYHVLEQKRYARRTSKGFPDLLLVRGEALVFAEIKSEEGRLSKAQEEWIAALVPIAEVFVWRPSDWVEIVEVLQKEVE